MPVRNNDGIGHDLGASAPKLHVLEALIDTGATSTNITPAAAAKLGLEPIGMREQLTANGVIGTPYYLFHVGILVNAKDTREMLIPEKIIEGPELIHSNFPFDILLGMDVISQGKLTIMPGKFEFSL